ncbi:MAG: GDSL-type esterase/lipase family protein [Paludibacteraceae bacterium]|nr:GDSL-type esterase/lipase family protein [Paludibacteraceae bacterium]
MKAYKVIIFIVAVFAILAVIGLLMPREGIDVGNTNVSFVSPKEIIMGEDSIEHYVAQKDSSMLLAQKDKEKLDSFELAKYEVVTSDNAIWFPDNDPAWMDDVFNALRAARDYPIRVIHYGDSQIEIDRITSEIRESFQNEFGGYGVGMVPAIQTVRTTAIHQSCNRTLKRYIVFSPDSKMKSRQYGPMGVTAELNEEATFDFSKIQMKGTKPRTKYFGRIGIIYENSEGVTGTIFAKGKKYPIALEPGKTYACVTIPDSTDRATVSLKGKALIHAFTIDGAQTGVQVDNVAMRGCSGTVFTQINRESMGTYFSRFNVPLIIMQFGGNAMAYLRPGKSLHEFCNGLRRQFAYFHRISPGSKILFIGPSDMSTKVKGKLQTYPQLPIAVDSLRQMCQSEGVAFWDLYSAMGGWNSMLSWVHGNPQLAGPDYVHFTPAGAARASKMLMNAITKAYDYYLLRHPEAGTPHNLKEYAIDEFNGKTYSDGIVLPRDTGDLQSDSTAGYTPTANSPDTLR